MTQNNHKEPLKKEKPSDQEDNQKESAPEVEEVNVDALNAEIFSLKEQLKRKDSEFVAFEAKLNKNFLELIDKKSKEVSEILATKTSDIETKIKSDYQSKLDYFYESQLISLVNLFAQFETIVSAEVTSPELKNYLIGFQMFLQQFKQIIEEFNIQEINPTIGNEFDSSTMIAIKTEDVKDLEQKNKILAIYSKGFKLKERIIKLSEVLVAV